MGDNTTYELENLSNIRDRLLMYEELVKKREKAKKDAAEKEKNKED